MRVVSFWEEETRGDTAELATKEGRQVFQEKNRGVTPSVAAPGVTHPSDATAQYDCEPASNAICLRNASEQRLALEELTIIIKDIFRLETPTANSYRMRN